MKQILKPHAYKQWEPQLQAPSGSLMLERVLCARRIKRVQRGVWSEVTATRVARVVGSPASNTRRVFEAGVTAYLLYNGSATYVQ